MIRDVHNVYTAGNFAEGRRSEDILFNVNVNSMKTET
jgi:hypothetical protein